MRKLYVVIFILMSMRVWGYINIYPAEFDKDITHGADGKFRLYNRLNKPVKYRIYLEEESEKNSMLDWIEIYPTTIFLKPLESKEIKILITPKKGAKDGDYSARLVVKQINIPREMKEKKVNFLTILKLKLKGRIKNK